MLNHHVVAYRKRLFRFWCIEVDHSYTKLNCDKLKSALKKLRFEQVLSRL